ncbi:hypothetical protein C8J56DRAFT_1060028 [Mycena floridula]|nr:hypothetical protein C8J56DRAFT_1060028 [Mycena floridula]
MSDPIAAIAGARLTKWKDTPLKTLFKDTRKPPVRHFVPADIEIEAELMEVLANEVEDDEEFVA